eukprot:scaffold270514_cov38-Prasinocladus_malaysianus.AAC.1
MLTSRPKDRATGLLRNSSQPGERIGRRKGKTSVKAGKPAQGIAQTVWTGTCNSKIRADYTLLLLFLQAQRQREAERLSAIRSGEVSIDQMTGWHIRAHSIADCCISYSDRWALAQILINCTCCAQGGSYTSTTQSCSTGTEVRSNCLLAQMLEEDQKNLEDHNFCTPEG